MKSLKSLLDFYIDSSIHVALDVYSLVQITENSLHFQYYENIAFTVFYGTIVGYNFLKYFESFQKGNFVAKQHQFLIEITFLSLITTVFIFYNFQHQLNSFWFGHFV